MGVEWERRRVSFGSSAGSAAAYHAARPDWLPAVAAWLLGADLPGRAVPLDVVDVGAGTGKLTRELVRAGHRVTAVDPSGPMLELLHRVLPSAVALPGTGADLPLGDASMDAVTYAQSWHWVDPAAAGAEALRVLRPAGTLAVGWNLRHSHDGFDAALADLVGGSGGDTADGTLARLDSFEGFSPVERRTWQWDQRLTPDEVVALAGTWSYVALLDDAATVLGSVLDAARRFAGADGRVTITYECRCFRAVAPADNHRGRRRCALN